VCARAHPRSFTCRAAGFRRLPRTLRTPCSRRRAVRGGSAFEIDPAAFAEPYQIQERRARVDAARLRLRSAGMSLFARWSGSIPAWRS
jgi:hypothetical protein